MNLKAYIANVGMTIKQFCKLIDCSQSYLSLIMSGKKTPGKRLARDIYNATMGEVQLETKAQKQKKSKYMIEKSC